jgi:uncharacterized protein YraI
MPHIRPGCSYCFKTLNPHDPDQRLETFVACDRCRAIYHALCWDDCGRCIRPACTGDQASAMTVPAPPRLRVELKTRTVPIKPPGVLYMRGEMIYTPAQVRRIRRRFLRRMAIVLLLAANITLALATNVVQSMSQSVAQLFSSPARGSAVQPTRPAQTAAVVAAPTAAPTAAVDQEDAVRVTTERLRIRTQPGTNAEVLATLAQGDRVQIVDQAQVMVEGEAWVHVRAGSHEGWVSQRFLAPAPQETPTGAALAARQGRVVNVAPQALIVRADPSTTAKVVTRIPEGAVIEIYEQRDAENEHWYRIRFNDAEGWVRADFVQELTP